MSKNPSPVILIVDDARDIRQHLRQILTASGYGILEAESGEAALGLADQADLILLDIILPGIDGFDVCRAVRARPETRFIPVILITSLKGRADRIAGIEAGADEFLSKPIDSLELQVRVKSLLRIQDQRREIDGLKETYTSMLVHDLRSPLTAVIGFAAMMEEDLDLEPELRLQSLHRIQTSAYRMLALVNDILDLTALEQDRVDLHLERIPMARLLKRVTDELAPIASGRQIRIRLDAPAKTPSIQADQRKLYQAIVNLLDNAIKFAATEVVLSMTWQPDSLDIHVQDDGAGIAADDISYVFEKWQRLHPDRQASKGTGLGLAIVKRLIEAHGGNVQVKSRPGETIFTCALPLG